MIANIVGPAVAGAILAVISIFGLVSSTTGAPDQNPADQEIVQYGDR